MDEEQFSFQDPEEVIDELQEVDEEPQPDVAEALEATKEALSNLVEAIAPKKKRTRVKKEKLDASDLTSKPSKAKKPKKPKPRKDIRTMFHAALKEIDIERLKKPWMAQKAFRLIDNAADLQAWVDSVLADTSRHHQFGNETCPVVAVDTETTGLDTRIVVDYDWEDQQTPAGIVKVKVPVYEVKIDISGICLSVDGIEGIYIPVTHELGQNIDRAECSRILQFLFDRSHLVFYNAKYDREVLRLTMGINMRPYPHFEDVQVLAYINDPKADLGDKKKGFTGEAGGLKALSKNVLQIEQIELDELGRVKCEHCPKTDSPFCECTDEEKAVKENKHSQKLAYVPFSWIPTEYALWYAAGDAICTWLLWKLMHDLARSRKLVHRIDHELVDSLTWVERQRFHIDTTRLARTVKGHQKKLAEYREKLRQLAVAAGFDEKSDDDGNVLEENKFNPGSTLQLQELLYKIKGFKVTKVTGAGNASCDAEVLEDLHKLYPKDEFLTLLLAYRDYMALHPENLSYDPKDHTARMYLKPCVVAGGRLAGGGGNFAKDGGFGLNPQGIKKVESYLMWKVKGNILSPDTVPVEEIEAHDECELHPSCFKPVKELKGENGKLTPDMPGFAEAAQAAGKHFFDGKWCDKAPGIVNNHIGMYMGYAACLVPGCKTCHDKFGVIIEGGKIDANEVINLRCLFVAPEGWTYFCVDYSNIEMRCAANVSGEPEFINEFLIGSGDFHSLTASKVFPEFTDPKTDKATRKSFRDLAKIINFALLYGGTAYTIFENMKKKNPNITFDECVKMVDKYWEGVPTFFDFCQRKQNIAKRDMTCTTATGRVINFQSQMDALHIHVPTEEEMDNYWDYRNYIKKSDQCKKDGDNDGYGRYRGMADRLWKDPETGVRNAMNHNKFVGKIQRVSVNVPLQGLAGDMMRLSLNRIRKWVESDPEISQVFHLHGSVHDEIDFTVKNEYVPFIMPRITRLMKLRKMHEKMGWKVPIESDAEYGSSWDVEHHLTGDADHKPAAYTEIKGADKYIPDLADFNVDTVKALLKALTSGEEKRVAKAESYLREHVHRRAHVAIDHLLKATDAKEKKKFLIAALQLHEFWTIDGIPDGDDATLETLEQYEQRNGLTKENRGFAPSFGFLGAIPLEERVKRPEIPVLGPPPVEPTIGVEVTDSLPPFEVDAPVVEEVVAPEVTITETVEVEPVVEETPAPAIVVTINDEEAIRVAEETLKTPAPAPVEEEDVFAEEPRPVAKPIAPPVEDDGIQEVATLDLNSGMRLKSMLGIGSKTVVFRYQGRMYERTGVGLDKVPDEFLIRK